MSVFVPSQLRHGTKEFEWKLVQSSLSPENILNPRYNEPTSRILQVPTQYIASHVLHFVL